MIRRQREASKLATCRIAYEEVGVLDTEDDEAIAGGNRLIEGDVIAYVVLTDCGIQMKGPLGNKSGNGLKLVGGGHPWPMVEASDV